jgi:hypothetical protein
MSVEIRGAGGVPGYLVTKGAQALPQTATSTLYTVTGGSVVVQLMAGLVTTALGATVTSLSLGNTPTGGANASASIATSAVVTSKVLGSWYAANFSAGVAAAPFQGNVVALQAPVVPFIVPAGVITWTTTAGDTGQMQWYLVYVPLDSGASVS